ncbi:MAG: hypothetical protein ABW208_03815 [Pyrinomonadaceae bacterium]
MTTSEENENKEGRTRAGGDVETRGASPAPGSAEVGGTRAGGDVETRGATPAPNDKEPSEEG